MKVSFSQITSCNRIEVSRLAILHNLNTIRKIVGNGVSIAPVMKACAYGHGYHQMLEILKDEKIRFFAVHSIDEADTLYAENPDIPILILGHVPLENLGLAVERDWRLTVYNTETIDKLAEMTSATGKPAYIHIKLETGTNRQGIDRSALPEFLSKVGKSDGIVIEGVSMHFANIEDTTDHSFARKQLAEYNDLLTIFNKRKIEIPIRHTASSAASLLFEETHFDMIRFGISLYGLWPSKQTYLSYLMSNKKNSLLQPALTWKSIISQLKDVPAGDYIGYGCTYRTTSDSRIAIIPLGYFDGYDRKLSNIAHVLIRGKRAPVRGRICMNIFMVDVTHIPDATLEDEVVLLGNQGDERISAEQLADWAGTINYEIVSRINPMLPRVIVD